MTTEKSKMGRMPQVEIQTPAPAGWTFDKRQAIGIGLGLLCLGVLIGAKLAAGSPAVERTIPIPVQVPCRDCAERAIQAERAKDGGQTEHRHPPAEHVDPIEHVVPGDSSVPDDAD